MWALLGDATGEQINKTHISSALEGYQSIIPDLATIRSNAANGNTAYGWGNHSGLYLRWAGSHSDATAQAWGTLTPANGYSTASHASTPDGGDMVWAYKDGRISNQLDGWFYQNEGQYRCLDTSDAGSFAPASHTHSQYLTGITSSMVTSALGYTPYNAANIGSARVAYATSAGNASTLENHSASYFAAASSLGNYLPLNGGTMSGRILVQGDFAFSGSTYGQVPFSVINNNNAAYAGGFDVTYPNQGATYWNSVISAGVSNSRNNKVAINFGYRGNGSTSNFLGLGLWGNDNILSIYGSGNVGIGTVSPSEKLHVLGNILASGAITAPSFIGSLTGNAASATQLQSSRTLWGQSFNGTGNVDGSLHIYSTGRNYSEGVRMHVSSNGWCGVVMCGSDNTGAGGTSPNTWSIHNHDGLFYINRNSAEGHTGYELCNINGNWGIGTISPSEKLHVIGNILATGAITAPSFIGSLSGNAASATQLQSSRTLWGQAFDGTGNVSGDMTGVGSITASGNIKAGSIGINTNLIEHKLDIDGYAAGLAWVASFKNKYHSQDGAQSVGIRLELGSYGEATIKYAGIVGVSEGVWEAATGIAFYTRTFSYDSSVYPTEKVRITGSGNVGIGTTSPSEKLHVIGNILATGEVTAGSDARWKHNIHPILNGIDAIMKLQPSEWEWNSDNHKGSGLIAQQIQSVLPHLVKEDGEGYLHLNYDGLHAYEISAIQSHETEIDRLRKKVAYLESEVQRLRS